METKIKKYISNQLPERQNLLSKIHEIIVAADKTVTASIEPMMGKEMIIYKAGGSMKYGLSSVKQYMSLHILPIYGSKILHDKYQALLNNAKFQKGCINFVDEKEMPLNIIKQLFTECSKIDLIKIREEYLKSKKNKSAVSKK